MRTAIRMWSDALLKAKDLVAPAPKNLQASRAAQLHANRCQAHLTLGDEAAALADAKAAVAESPGWPKAYYRQGTVLARQKSYAQAVAVFERGLKLDPGNAELRKSCDEARAALGSAADTAESEASVADAASEPPPPPPEQPPPPPKATSHQQSDASHSAVSPAAAVDVSEPVVAPPAVEPSLPIPKHVLETVTAGAQGPGFTLIVSLPLVGKSREVDLSVNPDSVELSVPDKYGVLKVALPKLVDDEALLAKYDTKMRSLKVWLPLKK